MTIHRYSKTARAAPSGTTGASVSEQVCEGFNCHRGKSWTRAACIKDGAPSGGSSNSNAASSVIQRRSVRSPIPHRIRSNTDCGRCKERENGTLALSLSLGAVTACAILPAFCEAVCGLFVALTCLIAELSFRRVAHAECHQVLS